MILILTLTDGLEVNTKKSNMDDRHKYSRNYQSGWKKRKLAAEKNKNHEEVLAKTPKLNRFFTVTISSNADNAAVADENLASNSDTAAKSFQYAKKASTDSALQQELNNNESVIETLDTEKDEKNNNLMNDVGLWTRSITEAEINFWIKQGSTELRHCDEKDLAEFSMPQSRDDGYADRKCSARLFNRTLPNNERVDRFWLCFSPSTGKLYCYVCKLLAEERDNPFIESGFSDWKHASERVTEHEKSKNHVDSIVACAIRAKNLTCLDQALQKQITERVEYWGEVLRRVISAIKFLAERGLAFRGSDEIFGSPSNGNFLGILELLAQYDPFLAGHIKKHGNQGQGHTNYMSSRTCEELIALMGDKVQAEIIARVKKAKYYSVCVDSTADEAHIDQLSVTIRYVEGLESVERFLTFLPNTGHTGREMAEALLQFLQKHGIDIQDCRGQSYDTAPNMSGKYNGMQAHILEENSNASYNPCCTHSLNLVGKTAASSCSDAVIFFDFIEELFVFFTGSTARYKILIEKLSGLKVSYSLKKLSDTRWSCRADASKAVKIGYAPITEALISIQDDVEQKDIARNQARGLLKKMSRLETAVYIVFWHEILERFDSSSKYLQSSTMTLRVAVDCLKSLRYFVESKRNAFESYEEAAKTFSRTCEYESRRVRSSNVRLQPISSKSATTPRSARDKFRIEAFLPVIDSLLTALEEKISSYQFVAARFDFMADFFSLKSEEIEQNAKHLVETYPRDLEATLGNELIQLKKFASLHEKKENEPMEIFLYRLIMNTGLDSTFVNAEILLRLYLSMMVTNCSSERSFSKMKLIKNRLRTSMNEDRLISLVILSSERDLLRELNFEDIISTFANRKCRKEMFV